MYQHILSTESDKVVVISVVENGFIVRETDQNGAVSYGKVFVFNSFTALGRHVEDWGANALYPVQTVAINAAVPATPDCPF